MTTPNYLRIQRWWRGVRVRYMLARWRALCAIRNFWVWNRDPNVFIENTPMN